MTKPFSLPMLKLSRHKAADSQRLFSFGAQDVMDVISYSGLEERPAYLNLDGYFFCGLFISAFPYVASSGWLNCLINFSSSIDIAFHIDSVEAFEALPKLHRKITELESSKRSMLKSGKIIGPELTDPLDSAIDLRNKIQRGQEKLFQVSIYISVTARSKSALEETVQKLEATLASSLFFVRVARYRQVEALQSILPRGENVLGQKRNLDSTSAALTFPFLSSELVHEDGILYGINRTSNSLVILDRFGLHNANSIVFAQSGSGKSYSAKVEILRQLMVGTKVIVIDPEREYERLAESVNGTYIKLGLRSKAKINPFDLNSTGGRPRAAVNNAQFLTELVSLMVDGLSPNEKAKLDRALVNLYKNRRLRAPLLKDLYRVLKNDGSGKLTDRLEKYISGTLSDIFSAPTNVDLSNRLVVFDIKDLPDTIRQLMMMVVANLVLHEVNQTARKRLLVIDEGWLLLQHEESAHFVAGLVRRARKYYLGVSIISQQANDFLNNRYGRVIAAQSSLRILMRQDSTTIKKVVEEFKLSEFEANYLLTCDRGEALLMSDQNHVAVKVVAADQEHPLITTDPVELYK